MDAQKRAAMDLKPCIAELVRTQHCPLSVVLLVQMVMVVPVQTPKGLRHAFRMMLTDGVKTIQATLVADLHWFVVMREIVVGAFVMLDKYKLAMAMRKNKNGSVAYLQITGLHAIGYVDGYDPSESTQSSISQPSKVNIAESVDKGVEKTHHSIRKPRLDAGATNHRAHGDSAAECLSNSVEEAQVPTKRVRFDTGVANPQTCGHSAAEFLVIGAEETQLSAKRVKLDPGQTSPHPLTDNVAKNVEDDSEETLPPTKKVGLDLETTGGSNHVPGVSRSNLTTLNNADDDAKGKEFIKINPNDKRADLLIRNEMTPLPSSLMAFPRSVYRRKIVEHWDRCHRMPFAQLQSPYSSGRATHAIFSKDQPGPHSFGELTDEQVDMLFPQACISLSQYAIYSIEAGKSLKRINRPLDIITLKSLAGLEKKQNRICDILAVIETEPSPIIKRPSLPPKRDIKLSDPTTLKRITLSVFVDAEHFTPAIGTICLIRNVRNHRFNGQSLNAYPDDCEGYDWFIPNPDFAVPREKIEWLREWWDKRLERKRRWNGCEVDESDPEFGYPAERPPPRERVFGESDEEDD